MSEYTRLFADTRTLSVNDLKKDADLYFACVWNLNAAGAYTINMARYTLLADAPDIPASDSGVSEDVYIETDIPRFLKQDDADEKMTSRSINYFTSMLYDSEIEAVRALRSRWESKLPNIADDINNEIPRVIDACKKFEAAWAAEVDE